MEEIAGIARQFIEFYYNQFDVDRKQLAFLYRDNSMLTFESTTVQGATAIVEKLSVSVVMRGTKHAVSTLDAQPSGSQGEIIILVTGQLLRSYAGGRRRQTDELQSNVPIKTV
ncbi:Nuclear transport factor 2 [Golovinomyces cichoracearum]|uniref:Nuclear transport factor 2 n=1 Tax=Golovinomyces cichoracearum TaxID=62708 RepID=A0A420IQH8_9PEZI|nr:Nuclear transport factor 2 [Golovinomyces cichoracearum]